MALAFYGQQTATSYQYGQRPKHTWRLELITITIIGGCFLGLLLQSKDPHNICALTTYPETLSQVMEIHNTHAWEGIRRIIFTDFAEH